MPKREGSQAAGFLDDKNRKAHGEFLCVLFLLREKSKMKLGSMGEMQIRNLGVGNVGVVGDFGADGTQVIHTQRMDIIMSGNPGEHRQLLLHHMEEIG